MFHFRRTLIIRVRTYAVWALGCLLTKSRQHEHIDPHEDSKLSKLRSNDFFCDCVFADLHSVIRPAVFLASCSLTFFRLMPLVYKSL